VGANVSCVQYVRSAGQAAYLVAEVGVDAHKLSAVDGSCALHVNSASALAAAVTARAVDLTIVLGVVADDVDLATSIVLDNLVVGVVGTAANDVGSTVAFEGDGILANVFEPHVLNGAGSKAVNTLALIGANDGVHQRSALLEHKDSICLA
jgi:hypothetical protein